MKILADWDTWSLPVRAGVNRSGVRNAYPTTKIAILFMVRRTGGCFETTNLVLVPALLEGAELFPVGDRGRRMIIPGKIEPEGRCI
jgi:hypothetical protein